MNKQMNRNYRIARQLIRLARLLVAAHKTGKFQCMLINKAGIGVTPADLSRLMQSTDPREQLVFRNSQATVDKISRRIGEWSKFSGVENADFREYMWARIEAKDALISIGNDGTATLDEKLSEKLHDSYTMFLELQKKQQVMQETSTLAGKIRSKSIDVNMFISEVQTIKEKFNGMTVNNRLSGGEADAWDRLEQAGGVQAGPYTVYTVNDFKTMSAVAGLDPVTNEDKTDWCVAHENSYFEDYGAPYYLFAQNRKPVMLLNDNDHQIKDVDNDIVQDGSMLEAVVDFLVNHLDYAIAPDWFECDDKEDFMPNDYYVLPRMIIKDENHVGFLKVMMDEYGNDMIDNIRSPEVLDKLSEIDDIDIRMHVAENVHMTDDMLAKMADENDDIDVINSIIDNENRGPGTFAALAGKEDDTIDRSIAGKDDLPEDIMMELAKRGCYYICENTHVTEDMIETLYDLYKHDYQTREAIAYCSKTPEHILRELVDENGEYECMADEVAWNANAPKDILVSLSKECYNSIARNEGSPPEALANACDALLEIENPDFYEKESIEKIAKHPNTSEETLVKLIKNTKSGIVLWQAARNKNLTAATIRRILSESQNRSIIKEFASNENTPPDILDEIAKGHYDDWIFRELVKNPNLTDDTLKYIIEYAVNSYMGDRATVYEIKMEASRRFGKNSHWESMMTRKFNDM